MGKSIKIVLGVLVVVIAGLLGYAAVRSKAGADVISPGSTTKFISYNDNLFPNTWEAERLPIEYKQKDIVITGNIVAWSTNEQLNGLYPPFIHRGQDVGILMKKVFTKISSSNGYSYPSQTFYISCVDMNERLKNLDCQNAKIGDGILVKGDLIYAFEPLTSAATNQKNIRVAPVIQAHEVVVNGNTSNNTYMRLINEVRGVLNP